MTGPTDWWSNSEAGDWGTWRVVQAPGADAYTAPPSLGVRVSHFLQSEVGEPGDLGVQCASLAHPVGTAERYVEKQKRCFSASPEAARHPGLNEMPPLAMCGERLCCSPSTPLGQAVPWSY